MKYFFLTICAVFVLASVSAQDFRYKVDFNFYFDNLEGSEPYADTRTLAGVSLAPEVGISWDGKHSVMVGASMLQDFGDSTFLTKADYIAYYKYTGNKFSLIGGSFPRKYSIARYPKTFFRDATYFYDPTLTGLMLQYDNKKNGYVELYADWYGANQELRIDEFMLVGSTEYRFFDKLLHVGGNVLLNHFKNEFFLKDSYLLERLLYNVYVGTDLSKVVPFFSEARVGFGLMSSMENKRIDNVESSWQSLPGYQADLSLRWKGVGVKNSFYFGKGQMPYFDQYNDLKFYFGSPFYRATRYNRTDIFYQWDKKFLSLKANFILNATDAGLSTAQMLTIGINISQIIKKGKSINYETYSPNVW